MILDDVDQVRARILLILGFLYKVTNAGLKLPEMLTVHVKCKHPSTEPKKRLSIIQHMLL